MSLFVGPNIVRRKRCATWSNPHGPVYGSSPAVVLATLGRTLLAYLLTFSCCWMPGRTSTSRALDLGKVSRKVRRFMVSADKMSADRAFLAPCGGGAPANMLQSHLIVKSIRAVLFIFNLRWSMACDKG